MEKNYVYPAKTLAQHRNKFKMPFTHKTTLMHGELTPICAPIEVVPGDTFKIDLASLIRMSTPIAPIMDNITMHIAAYFVPYRLVYEHFEEVMGANKDGAWITDKTAYSIPMDSVYYDVDPSSTCLGGHFGLGANVPKVSVLPGRAYYLIWNEFYRSQVVSAPYPIDLSSNGHILVDELGSTYALPCLPVGKFADYFTKCLPEPQKHAAIPFLPEDLKVGWITDAAGTLTTPLAFKPGSGDTIVKGFNDLTRYGVVGVDTSVTGDIVASVEEAWNNINALRFAFQLQKFYEKDARYGTRYFEMLNGHFGVTNPDLVLQRPQHLGEVNFRINVDQVLSTAGYSDDSATTVGAPGANSVTGGKGSLFTASFSEFGCIIIVAAARHEHTYGEFVSPLWTREDRLDFYDPVFANIGEQPVLNRNLACLGSISVEGGDDIVVPLDGVFGYQEAWAELRFIPNQVTGLLNPSATGSLDFWTLADYYTDQPLLNEDFIYENRNSIARALVTGETGPDYIADFYFDVTAVRPLPLFSIPGLADHH